MSHTSMDLSRGSKSEVVRGIRLPRVRREPPSVPTREEVRRLIQCATNPFC